MSDQTFIGVSYDKKRAKFQAYTRDRAGSKKTFGNHEAAIDAARAYDEGVIRLGLTDVRKLNFPDDVVRQGTPDPDLPFPVTEEQIEAKMDASGSDVSGLTADDLPAPAPGYAEPVDVTPPVLALSDLEAADYLRLKKDVRIMASGLGAALTEIRDRRLYRVEFKTFEDFIARTFERSRQWAYQLMDASATSDTLAKVGFTPANEREARELKGAAAIVAALPKETQDAIAKFIQATAGTERPSTSQVKAVAEIVARIDEAGTVQHPDNGEEVKFTDLTEPQRMAVISENVTNSTHERMERQKGHIQESLKKNADLHTTKAPSGKTVQAASWSDWCLNYAGQAMTGTQRLEIIVEQDPSGNPKAVARIVEKETGEILATGEPSNFLKGAIMTLIEELKAGGTET